MSRSIATALRPLASSRALLAVVVAALLAPLAPLAATSTSTPWLTGRRHDSRDERGDVPGWVLITVMTAGLVAGLWAIAGPALEGMLQQALSSVK